MAASPFQTQDPRAASTLQRKIVLLVLVLGGIISAAVFGGLFYKTNPRLAALLVISEIVSFTIVIWVLRSAWARQDQKDRLR